MADSVFAPTVRTPSFRKKDDPFGFGSTAPFDPNAASTPGQGQSLGDSAFQAFAGGSQGQAGFGTNANANPNATPPAFDITKTALFRAQQAATMQQLNPNAPVAGFDAQANIARDAQKVAQMQSAKAARDQLIGQGLKDTGQYITEGIMGPADKAVRDRADMERNLAGMREQAIEARQAQGQTSANQLLSLQAGQASQASSQAFTASESAKQRESSERIAFAGLNVEEKKLAMSASQFQDEMSFKKYALQAGFDESAADRAWQASQNAAQITSQEKIAFANLSVQEQQLAQQAMQFTSKQDFDKWALQQNLSNDQAQRIWQATENEKQRKSTENIAYAGLSIEEKKLAQDASQFQDELSFKRYALQAGFDENAAQRAWQAAQNAAQIASTERIATANLSIEEKKLAESSRQFDSKLDFDKWATQAGLDDKEKERIWQANQNDKQMANQVQIAQMQINQDQWKQTRIEALTKAGWDNDNAQKQADREVQISLANQNAALQREIEAGRLSMEDKKLVQDAAQFQSEQEYKKWATQQGIDQQVQDRVWKTNERVATETFTASQANLDRQLQTEIESGRLQMQDKQLAQEAFQFSSKQDFDKWALEKNLANDQAQRIWQSNENTQGRLHELQMQQIQNAFQQKNQDISALLNILPNMDPKQAADIMNQLAKEAGISHVRLDSKGNPVKDKYGQPIMDPGLQQYGKQPEMTFTNPSVLWGAKGDDIKGTATLIQINGPDGKPVLVTYDSNYDGKNGLGGVMVFKTQDGKELKYSMGVQKFLA